MTATQQKILSTLAFRSMTTVELEQATGLPRNVVGHSLRACFRRSWVTITPQQKWCRTARGRSRLGAEQAKRVLACSAS